MHSEILHDVNCCSPHDAPLAWKFKEQMNRCLDTVNELAGQF